MAVLENIRVKLGVFITILIALALLSFIVDPTTLQSAMSMFSSKNDVGSMNGKDITYMDYSKKLEYYTNLQTVLTGSTALNEQATEQVAQGTWQSFLKDYVYIPAIKKTGIDLGEEETFDMAQGRDISPVLSADPVFAGEDGAFDRTRLVTFIQSVSADPTGVPAQYWEYIQQNMEEERLFAKYQSLLSKSNYATPVEVRRDMEENNQTANVRFVLTPVSFGQDSTITVSEQEINKYYEAHKHQYEQQASRDIEYVVFPIVPSQDDINLAEAQAEKIYEEFTTTDNMRLFLARNSDQPFDTRYYKAGELASISAPLDSFAFEAKVGDILPLFQETSTFRAARLMDIKQLPDSVFVNHILIQRESSDLAKKVADSVMTLLAAKPDRFAELAIELSADQNTNVNPGEIGWFTQTAMIPGLESTLEAEMNKPFIAETQYGVHILKVSQRTNLLKKVQLAVLVKDAVAGKETYQNIYNQANTLAAGSSNLEEFNRVARENSLAVIPAMNIAQGAKTISGYENMREVTRWAFEAKYADVSEVFSVDNKYFFVAAVTGVHKEGYATLTEKRNDIYTDITMEKKLDKLYAEIKGTMEGQTSLDAWAEANGKTITTKTGMAFATAQQTDGKFLGAVCGAPAQTLCGPIKGDIGVYVFTVDEKVDGAFYTEEDAKQRALYTSSVQMQMLPMVLTEAADVKDNRARFF